MAAGREGMLAGLRGWVVTFCLHTGKKGWTGSGIWPKKSQDPPPVIYFIQ